MSNTSVPESDDSSLEGPDVEIPVEDDRADDRFGSENSDGLGPDGTVPSNPDGLAAGHTKGASHFNEEEDPSSSENSTDA